MYSTTNSIFHFSYFDPDYPTSGLTVTEFMHQCAPAYFSRAVRDVLSNTCHDRWIGRGGPTAWPPRFTPYWNLLDIYLWGHLNTLVYAAPADNEETPHHRFLDACQTIHIWPGIFERMWWSMMRRVETGIVSHGGHFSTYYKCTFSVIPRQLSVSGHMLV
jgi:hypothetical protein